jgi:hypothetical protein
MIIRISKSLPLVLLLFSCTAARHFHHQCDLQTPVTEALATLLQRRWDDVRPASLGSAWPLATSWGSRAEGDSACSGTVTFSHLGYVVDNACRCCDVFSFSDVSSATGCEQRLSSVTLVRYASTRDLATITAERFLAVVSPTEPTLSGSTATRVRDVGPAVQESSSVEIVHSGDGWVVRMMVYRVPFDVSAIRLPPAPARANTGRISRDRTTRTAS